MKTISTTEAFARLSRNLTSALSRSLFTLSLILTLLFSFSVNEAWGKYIYLSTANFTNWENDGATFKLYPGTGSDVDGTKVYDHMYRFDVPAVSTAANAMYFKRMSSDGGTKWNEYTVTYSASYDTYKVTGWDAGSCANTNMIEIYLDVHTNWYVDGPDFWLYPGTGSNVKGTFVGTNLLLFSVPNASGTMWFKRYQAGSTNPDSETGRWNQASVTYNSSKNTYEVTDWGAVSASYNIKIVEKGNYIYFDNSQTAWSTTYKYFVAGHDKPTAYSSTYAFTAAPITHTKLFYYNNTTTSWRDATYFAFIGNGSAFGSGEWKKSNLSAASKYTAAYENVGDLEWGKIYLFKPASGNNGAELTLNTQTVSSSLNTTQTFNYALSTDGGSTYALMSSGNTPGQLVLASYKFVDDTYNSVSANTDQTLSANSTTYTKSLSTVAYTGATTLTESSTQTGYTFVGWYEGNTQKATTASYTYYPTDDVTVTARFKAHRYSIAFDANDAQYIGTATGSTASVANVAYNTNATLTSNGFNRSGYTFAGWATTASGDIAYTDEQSVSNLSSTDGATVTLYAKWTPNTYTITLNPNGGTGSTASVEIEYGQTPPNTDALNPYFRITNPTKPGYTFRGWYTAADGGDLVINTNGTFNANVDGYTSTSPGNIWIRPNNATLYAHWEQTNLALNKTAYAGWSRTVTEINDTEIPSKAVDGNLSTQHIQYAINDNFATKGWWGVDLGDNYVLSDLYIYWQEGQDGRAPRYYEIQATVDAPTDFSNDHAMDDGIHWHTIKTISGVAQNLGSTPNIISFTSGEHVTARYVRIVNKDASRKPMAIAEFQAYAYDVESCSAAANTPTASFAGIEGGRIKLNLAATNTNSEALTNFAVLYDGIYYDVTASAGVGYVTLPSHRDITVRVYAYNTCMQRSSGYVDVAVGNYVNPVENLAELKTTWVSYTNNNTDEKQANLNDGVLDNKGWIPYQNTGKNAWMVVDLGDTYQISTIQTFFATGRRSTNYKIYGRQNDPSTDDVRGDNTKWVELASKSSSINAGATESDVNESAVSFTGAVRYVRFESFAEEWDDVANGFKLLEFRVFGSAFKSADVTGPVISTCEIDASAENVTSTVLHLVATDAVDGEVFNYEISTDGGSNWTKYSTDPVTRLVTITDLTSGSYTFTVRAYDIVGNYSANSTVSVDIWNPAANLALNKTSWAGHETGGAGEAKDKANDGSLTTFWTSWAGANPGDDWWCVDLGNYYQLSEIDVFWHQIDGPINLHSEKYTIRARQNLSGTASEMEAIMRDSTLWYTIVRQSTTPIVGNTESNKNAYTLNTPARYLLLKSTQRNALNQQIRLSEFRAYGSGFAAADTHVPVISSATASYNDDGKAYLTLTATDTEDGTVRLFRIYNPYTETYSLQQTNGSNQIVIDDLPTCTDYTFQIQAMDKAAQLSEVTNLVVNVPLISTTNLAPLATITSGTNSGAGLRNLVNNNTADTWEVAAGTIAGDNEWVTFQWEHPYKISTVKVYWETHAGGDTRPKDYEWQVSNDGTHFVPVLHYTTKPGAEETYTINTTAQYIRLFVNKHDQYKGMCLREVEMRGGCAEDSDLPIMLFAEVKLEEIFRTNAKVHVGAIHKTIPSNELLYHVIVNNGTPITITAGQVVDNYITISGLTKETAYNVKIYAAKISDTEENRSANYKEVNFTTQGDYSDYYLANSINGWLAVNGGEWTDAMNAWRFRTTDVDGIYNLTHEVSATENWIYLIYNRATGTRTPGDRTASVVAGRDFKAVMHDLDHFVTNYSNLYIAGTAVGTAENTRSEQNRLTWIDATHAVWEGRVTNGGTFRITSYDNVLQTDFITPTAQTYNEGYSHARLTFTFDEEADFTWTWKEIPSEQFCSRSGGAGSGAVLDGSAFGVGESYSVYAYMSAGGKWIVEATCSGIEAANAYLQPFTSLAGDGRQEFAMAKIDNYFRVEIDPASITYKLNNLARYVVKFAVPAGIRYTDVHYYDFTDSGECAPDFFDIYHHDDAAAAPEGARTSFPGGVIMQPIRYFRHYDNSDWTTVCVPFDVSKVTVYDTEAERDYSLYPRFNNGTEDVEGFYWLKTFSEALPITSFESAWEQLTVNTAESNADVLTTLVKPAKNTPYIIAFPDDGSGYYTTNWVVFHGAAGQTIDSEFTGQSGIELSGGYDFSQVQLQGNNTMHQSSTLTNIYTIDEGDDYFTRKTVAVPAFEAYVIGTAQVQASYAAVRYRGGQSVPTGVDNLPSTGDMQGSIYTATGVRVASFDGRDAMEHCLNHLSTGVYVVYTQSQVNKIVIP